MLGEQRGRRGLVRQALLQVVYVCAYGFVCVCLCQGVQFNQPIKMKRIVSLWSRYARAHIYIYTNTYTTPARTLDAPDNLLALPLDGAEGRDVGVPLQDGRGLGVVGHGGGVVLPLDAPREGRGEGEEEVEALEQAADGDELVDLVDLGEREGGDGGSGMQQNRD